MYLEIIKINLANPICCSITLCYSKRLSNYLQYSLSDHYLSSDVQARETVESDLFQSTGNNHMTFKLIKLK